MTYSDFHIHSEFSADSDMNVLEICETAYQRGMSSIALTEHWDVYARDHVHLPYGDNREHYRQHDAAAKEAVLKAKDMFEGKLDIVYSIELGQPYADITDAEILLNFHDFDFVLGSIHTVASGTDYYHIDYERADVPAILQTYYEDHLKLINFGRIDSIGHLDYPIREMKAVLQKPASMKDYKDCVAEVLRAAAAAGIGLEINTRGLSSWFDRLSPEPWVLELYRDFGGQFVTTGSDAHNMNAVGFGIKEASALAASVGLDVVRSFTQHKPIF